MESQTKQINSTASPSRAWYFLPLLVFLIGISFSLYYIVKAFTQPAHTIEITPQTNTVNIVSPGKYTLWILRSTSSIQNNEILVPTPPSILDQSIIVFKNTQTKNANPVISSKGWHFQGKDFAKFSLGDVYFDKPGVYSVTISNPPNETYILYLHQPHIKQIIKYMVFSLVSLVLAVVLSIILALIIFMKRTKPLVSQPLNAENYKNQAPQGIAWAVATHLSALAGLIFPLGNIIVPLFMWAVKRHESTFVDFNGKEAVNFQISITIYYIICIILSFIIIGLLLIPLLAAFQLVAIIIAAISASHGNLFRYPLSIRFIK